MQHKIFYVREFIKTESATTVQRAFLLRFNIQPPTRKSICRWNHQFKQIGSLCKGKSSGRPRVSEENLRWIQQSFERSARKSTRRASRELGIPQPTVWRVLRRRLLFNWVHFFNHPVYLLLLTVEFAVDLGSSLQLGKTVRPLFVISNQCIPLKIHWAKMLSCFVCVR